MKHFIMDPLTCHQHLVSELGHMIIIGVLLSWVHSQNSSVHLSWRQYEPVCFFFLLALFNLHPIRTLSLLYLTPLAPKPCDSSPP